MRERVPKFTPKKRAIFLTAITEGQTVRKAAELACVSHVLVYRTREADPAFAAEWEAALEIGTQYLEQEAWRRATQGVTQEHAIYHQGVCVGRDIKTEYSDTLLIFLLKARRPEVYRERIDLRLSLLDHARKRAAEWGIDEAEAVAEAEALLQAVK